MKLHTYWTGKAVVMERNGIPWQGLDYTYAVGKKRISLPIALCQLWAAKFYKN
ncbi:MULTISPECIES: hypothetical protein [unclassified Arenibacter]|jgi:hypothetical protein|uniref:hypothetical protein n=1 Tax=unclassified Arenibacter TaxID=2615047 RepID=UPI0015F2A2B4|nr:MULTISPECIES: hypothetical protein [unclassified Arenibacter]